jgi:hypothetical protein
MKAIITQFFGPGNVRGSRMVAHDGDGNRISLSIEPEWTIETAHDQAAIALCRKMKWAGPMMSGWATVGGKRMKIYTFVDDMNRLEFDLGGAA